MKEGPSESKENKENREKKGEREASKGRASANRKGKGASRRGQGEKPERNNINLNLAFFHTLTDVVSKLIHAQTARPEENGVEAAPVDKGSDRGRRVKGSRG